MWGQEYDIIVITIAVRIIPTRVGTSVSDDMTFLKKEDHPHACGDKFHDALFSNSEGSSPRVWGQAEKMNLKNLQKRIIPTRVGTSDMGVISCRPSRDHPHACGDK